MTGRLLVDLASSPGLAVLRLSNGSRRNAISGAMWEAIATFAGAIGAMAEVRVVLIEGDGAPFSAGADISDFDAMRSGAGNAARYDDLVEDTCRRVEAIPQPVIAAIEGHCLGAGASLAASCDLRVAAQGAGFAVPAARLGLGYDMRGIARFRRVFGPAAATDLLFTAERMSAADAYRLGAVQRLVADGEAGSAARALAARIAANAPLTVRAAKAAQRALASGDAELDAEAQSLAAKADASADYAEGRAAFAEKRQPRFTGA